MGRCYDKDICVRNEVSNLYKKLLICILYIYIDKQEVVDSKFIDHFPYNESCV